MVGVSGDLMLSQLLGRLDNDPNLRNGFRISLVLPGLLIDGTAIPTREYYLRQFAAIRDGFIQVSERHASRGHTEGTGTLYSAAQAFDMSEEWISRQVGGFASSHGFVSLTNVNVTSLGGGTRQYGLMHIALDAVSGWALLDNFVVELGNPQDG